MNAEPMKHGSRTDWARVDATRDEDIDYTDNPKLDADFFAEATQWSGPKPQVTLWLDSDVLQFLQAQSKDYQTIINAVLRKYMKEQKTHTT
jgi:uncharacterized protein (DUF4415 family)